MLKYFKWLIVLALAGAAYFVLGGPVDQGGGQPDADKALTHQAAILQAAQDGMPVFLDFYGQY